MAETGLVLPDTTDIRLLLSDLFAKQVSVSTSSSPAELRRGAVGVYSTEVAVVGLAICDLSLAASIAAALSLVPVGVVTDSVRAGEIEDFLLENLTEVLNVAARWFNQSGAPRARLREVISGKTPSYPGDVEPLLNATTKAHFAVEVPGYPGGALTLTLA
jgi:hypothetical protein